MPRQTTLLRLPGPSKRLCRPSSSSKTTWRESAEPATLPQASLEAEYLAFCDADDEVEPGWVSGLLDVLAPSAIVASTFDERSLNDPAVVAWINPPVDPPTEPLGHLHYLPTARGAGLAVASDTMRSLGGFAEDMPYGEDADFVWRAHALGVTVKQARGAVVRYRFRSTMREAARQAVRAGMSDVDLYRRHRANGSPRGLAQACRPHVGMAIRSHRACLRITR